MVRSICLPEAARRADPGRGPTVTGSERRAHRLLPAFADRGAARILTRSASRLRNQLPDAERLAIMPENRSNVYMRPGS